MSHQFTPSFATEMASRLQEAALERITDPVLRDLLQCESYFTFYNQQLQHGSIDALVEADAPAWLQVALSALDQTGGT